MKAFLIVTFLLSCLITSAQDTSHQTIYFGSNQDFITDNSKAVLNAILKNIAGRKISTLQVDGYTDSIGSKQYNLPLSERRAQNCLNYFGNLSTLSDPISNAWGYENSMESNLNESGRMKNRRVEITIILVNDKITTDHILELKPFTEDKEAEIFSINSSTRDTITINTKDGIVLRIPPQALVDKSGKPVTEPVKLIIKAYLTPADILLAGLHTVSDSALLETGGMVNIQDRKSVV